MIMRFTLIVVALAVSQLAAAPLLAAEPVELRSELICDQLASPVWVGTPPKDANRLFVLEQRTGQVRVWNRSAKAWNANPALTIQPLLSKANEQGLLGLAFHPQFAKNGYIYLYYTAPGGGPAGQVEIARFTMTGEIADPATKVVILSIDQPQDNHNGGWIEFGPDGFLWLGVGDGGGGDDRHGNPGHGQDQRVLLAKMLRIDVDAKQQPYGIPKDNPYANERGKRPEIVAFGLRNPWRCAFDRKTGDLWIGDVGQNAREEINVLPKGRFGLNYGWRPREGTIHNKSFPDEKPITKATEPILDYDRSQGRISVTGGYVYRGSAIPGLVGTYLYADFAAQRFYTVDAEGVYKNQKALPVEVTQQLNPELKNGNVSTFGEDADGELFYCGWSTGRVYQIVKK